MIKKATVLTVILLSVLFISCNKDNGTIADPVSPAEYYPLKVGSYFIYDVDSISYNDFTNPVTIDSIHYQVKESYTDTFYDESGFLNYRLTRHKRAGNDSVSVDEMPWEVSNIWFVTVSNKGIERVEENIRIVSLSHPVFNNKQWDGNAFNYMDAWDFTYKNLNSDFNSFSSTLQVNQTLSDNLINYKNYMEVYAKDIGLVYRKRIDIESQKTIDPSIPVIDRPEKGFQYFQSLNSYFIPE